MGDGCRENERDLKAIPDQVSIRAEIRQVPGKRHLPDTPEV